MRDGPRRIIRGKYLPSVTGLKRTAINDEIAKGNFPKAVPLTEGGRAVGWFEDEIIDWQRKRDEARDRESPDATPKSEAKGQPDQPPQKPRDK